MRYMFLIYSQETDEPLSPEEIDQVVRGHRAVMADAGQKGILLGVERLKPTRAATTIRMTNGRPTTIDGPFAGSRENHYKREAEGEEVIFESFTLLIASPVHKKSIRGVNGQRGHEHDDGDSECTNAAEEPGNESD